MSDFIFDRIAVLKVFETQVVDTDSGGKRINQIDQEGLAFPSRFDNGDAGFRIRFQIEKVAEPTPNLSSIFIYNLGSDSRSKFERLNNLIVLEAGYGNNAKVIFRGNVSRTRTRREGADYITQIEAADGLFAYQNSRVDQSFNKGVRLSEVVNTLTKSFGLGTKQIKDIPNRQLNSSVVLSGKSNTQLTEILESYNLRWFIDDGAINILGFNSGLDGEPVFLSPEKGLIGIPEIKDVGIEFQCLLNPDLKVGGLVIIASKFVSGPFRIARMWHNGDTFEGNYLTKVEAASAQSASL